MEIHELSSQLHAHEQKSEHRFEKLQYEINKQKEHHKMEPVNVKNIFEPGLMGAAGLGGGSALGAAGGAFVGSALARGGLLGGVDGRGVVGECVTPMQLTSAIASVIDSNQNTALMGQVADVKAAVPLAEAQVQLALAGAQSEIINNQTTIATAQAVANQLTNQNIANAIASSLASQGAIKESVAAYGVANLTATKDAQFATTTAIAASTKEILAAINGNEIANLQRQLGVAESRAVEDRAIARSREVEVNVTQSVTQNQTAINAQSQQQQQFQILATLAAEVRNLANDVQVVRQGQTIFNSGTMAGSGTQTAANTKVG